MKINTSKDVQVKLENNTDVQQTINDFETILVSHLHNEYICSVHTIIHLLPKKHSHILKLLRKHFNEERKREKKKMLIAILKSLSSVYVSHDLITRENTHFQWYHN